MDPATWSLIETERRTLADLLADLTPGQWSTGSLCSEWTVHHVAAHVAMTAAAAPSVGTMAAALARTRGRLWAAGRDVAIEYARLAPREHLVTALRGGAASRRRPVFVADDNILVDLVVHGQDIAVPLGITRTVPREAGLLALRRIWTMGWPFHASRRLRGLRLVADNGWSAGDGLEISGTAADLLLLMTGRDGAALSRLNGPGVPVVGRRDEAGAPTSAPGRRPVRIVAGTEHDTIDEHQGEQ